MLRSLTPLRYPGGKGALTPYLQNLIRVNGIRHGHYVEPYCGGAGAAVNLLHAESVERVHLNDIDPAVHSFWWSAVNASDDICELIATAPLTVVEWERQREMYKKKGRASRLRRGFAFFYLNRVNRSGILNGGLIGGRRQTGQWLMDARFNRDDLISRIQKISSYRDRISVSNEDALDFLKAQGRILPKNTLIYLDPPYYCKGQCLYENSYEPGDHAAIAKYLSAIKSIPWIVSYDSVPQIHELYSDFRQLEYGIGYSARKKYRGSEVMIFSNCLELPDVADPLAAGRKPSTISGRKLG